MSAETWAGALITAEQSLRWASDLIESRKGRRGVEELLNAQAAITEAIRLILKEKAR